MSPTPSISPADPASRDHALSGSVVFTAVGPFLVEADQSAAPHGYLLARRAERPMSQPRLIRTTDVVTFAAAATVTSAAGAPAHAC